jgi:hypothetical protein
VNVNDGRTHKLVSPPPFRQWGPFPWHTGAAGRIGWLKDGTVIDRDTLRVFFSPEAWIYALHQGEL